jgi:hypothetical protein
VCLVVANREQKAASAKPPQADAEHVGSLEGSITRSFDCGINELLASINCLKEALLRQAMHMMSRHRRMSMIFPVTESNSVFYLCTRSCTSCLIYLAMNLS